MASRSQALRSRTALLLAFLILPLSANFARAQGKPKVEIVPQIPHSYYVNSVAFSADGTRLLSGSGDKTMKLWDAATGALLRTFQGHSNEVQSVAFSADGTRLLSGSGDQTLKLWDAATGALLRTFEGHSSWVNSVAFSPDGTRLLSGSRDETLKFWDAATGAELRTFEGHSSGVNSVSFSPDGTRLLSGSWDNTMKLWDAATGAELRTFQGHSEPVNSVSFSPDGTRLLSGSWDNTMKLWDAATGAELRTFQGHSEPVRSVAFSPDGTRLLSGGADETLKLWDAATGALLRTFEGHSEQVWSVAFSPDGTRLLSGSHDNTMKLWNAATGALLRTFEGPVNAVWSVAFSADGTRLLSGSHDKTLKLLDAATGALLRTFQGHSELVFSVAFSPDGTRLLSGGWDNTMKLWDAATGALLRTFEGHSNTVTSVAFSPDGTRLLSGGHDKTLKLWDAATGAELRTFEGHSDFVWSVAFLPDGTRLLSGSWDNTMKLWDAATGAELRTFEGHSEPVRSVAFSPDGTRLLSGGADETLKLWDAATGALLRTFEGHSEQVWSVAFSPDGTRLLSGGHDKTLKLWDAASGALLRTFEGHSGAVTSVAFLPNGRFVISGSIDGTVRVWTAGTGLNLVSLLGTPNGEWLAITPEGFFAASPNGAEMLNIVRGLDVTTIGQVHQSLYNPDLLHAALAGDPEGEVRDAAKIINLEKVLDSGPAPSVAITSHVQGSQSKSDVVSVQVRITDRRKGIGRIEWRVNGVTAAVTTKAVQSGLEYALTQQLALDPGKNVIEVVVYNASNLLASLPARTTITFTGSADRAKPNLYILAIGINTYQDRGWEDTAFGKLTLAVKDAETFAADMKTAAAGQYGRVKVITALDQQATKGNLSKMVDQIAREIHPRDTFILFAAAHGFSIDGRYYLIPQDYDGGANPKALAQRAIGQGMLQHWLANRIKAKKAVVFLDTCESGALIAGHTRSRTDSEAAIGRLHEATGRPVLTASALGQYAYEDSLDKINVRHGLFTWALLQALRHGDSNRNKLIELSELVAYVQDQVPKLAAKLGGAGSTKSAMSGAVATSDVKQQARFGSRGEDFVLVRRLE